MEGGRGWAACVRVRVADAQRPRTTAVCKQRELCTDSLCRTLTFEHIQVAAPPCLGGSVPLRAGVRAHTPHVWLMLTSGRGWQGHSIYHI